VGCKHSDPRSCHVADYKASATPCNQQYRMFAPAESGCAWSERSVADAYWAARGGRPGHRRGTRRSDSDHRVPVSRAQDDPDPRDPRTSDRRGRHDPHRRATVAATLLLDAVSRGRPPASA